MPKRQASSKKPGENVVKRLRALRESMGWTKAELGRRFGVTHSAVSQWESGESRMSGPALKLLEIFEKKASRFDEF